MGFDQRNWDANKNVENSANMFLVSVVEKSNGKCECYPKEDINIVNSTGDYTVCPLGLAFLQGLSG